MASRNVLAARRHMSVNRSREHLRVIAEALEIELPIQPKIRYPDAQHELAAREVYIDQILRLIREKLTGQSIPEDDDNLIDQFSGAKPVEVEEQVEDQEEEQPTEEEEQQADNPLAEEPADSDEAPGPIAEEEAPTFDPDEVIGGKTLMEWYNMTPSQFKAPHRGVNKAVRQKILNALGREE